MSQRVDDIEHTDPPFESDADKGADQLLLRIAAVSELTGGARELVRLTSTSNCLDDLHDLLQADPSLVAQILRRLNSHYYGLDTEIHDLGSATRLLGFQEIRNLAITVYLSRMFEQPMVYGGFACVGLWNHSVAVATASQLMSRVCNCGLPADAFVAGLLHDIGLLLACRQMRRHFMRVIDSISSDELTSKVEEKIYHFDHAELGAYVAERWGFPAPIVDAIRYHHEIDRYLGEHLQLVSVVAMANYLCSRAGWTALGTHNVVAPADNVYQLLGLDEVALSVIWEQLSSTLEKASFLART